MGRHERVEHVGEVELRLEAPTLAGLFTEGARGLADLMGRPGADSAERSPQAVRLEAPDVDALLVAWLDELVFRGERDGLLFEVDHIDEAGPRRLRASIRGRPIEEVHTQVKAATFHGLRIREGPAGFSANVVLDV